MSVNDNSFGREYYQFNIFETKKDNKSNNVLKVKKINNTDKKSEEKAYKINIRPEK